jgi:hypothetical protein
MEQTITAPDGADVEFIATLLANAGRLVQELAGAALTGTEADLALLQRTLDSGSLQRDATPPLQALGIAFGALFSTLNPEYDWCMVEDEYGRDPAIRYRDTTLLLFPLTMLSKRIEEDGHVDVAGLYHGLREQLDDIIGEHYADA